MNERLKELYELALFKKLVSSKTEFANFIGMDNSSFSHALKNTGRVNAHNAIMRAEHALMQAGININESGAQVVNSTTGDVLGGNAQKNLTEKTDTGLLLEEMAAQREMYAQHINRLLTIIEKMQS